MPVQPKKKLAVKNDISPTGAVTVKEPPPPVCFTKRRKSEHEEIAIVNALPSFEVDRELLIAECLQETERMEHYRYLIECFESKIALYKNRMSKSQ